jgi:NAD(P)-dependent dehydrogenase (short-subunit alcohol dehydrogenase family)
MAAQSRRRDRYAVDSTNIAGLVVVIIGAGSGLGEAAADTSAEGWIGDAVRFWAKHINDRAARKR